MTSIALANAAAKEKESRDKILCNINIRGDEVIAIRCHGAIDIDVR